MLGCCWPMGTQKRMAKTVKRSNANMNSAAAAVAVLMLVASVTDTASAKEYTVGGTTGWDYAPTTSFYSEWSNKLRIVPGDKIGTVFRIPCNTRMPYNPIYSYQLPQLKCKQTSETAHESRHYEPWPGLSFHLPTPPPPSIVCEQCSSICRLRTTCKK